MVIDWVGLATPQTLIVVGVVIVIIFVLFRSISFKVGPEKDEKQEEKLETRELTSEYNAQIEEKRAVGAAAKIGAAGSKIQSHVPAMKAGAQAIRTALEGYATTTNPTLLRNAAPEVEAERKLMDIFHDELNEYGRSIAEELRRLESLSRDLRRESTQILSEQSTLQKHDGKITAPAQKLNVRSRMKVNLDILRVNLTLISLTDKETIFWGDAEKKARVFYQDLGSLYERMNRAGDLRTVLQCIIDFDSLLTRYESYYVQVEAAEESLKLLLTEQQAGFMEKNKWYANKEELEKEYRERARDDVEEKKAAEEEVVQAA